MKILIVDDSASMRTFLRNLLSERAEEIREAADGASAVRAFGEFHPDLVLMDIRMPGMDGIEATERIIQTDPGAHVIIVTEYNSTSYRSKAKRAGAERFFAKDDLMELGKYLGGGQPEGGTA